MTCCRVRRNAVLLCAAIIRAEPAAAFGDAGGTGGVSVRPARRQHAAPRKRNPLAPCRIRDPAAHEKTERLASEQLQYFAVGNAVPLPDVNVGLGVAHLGRVGPAKLDRAVECAQTAAVASRRAEFYAVLQIGEDWFFSCALMKLGYSLAPPDIAESFAMETEWREVRSFASVIHRSRSLCANQYAPVQRRKVLGPEEAGKSRRAHRYLPEPVPCQGALLLHVQLIASDVRMVLWRVLERLLSAAGLTIHMGLHSAPASRGFPAHYLPRSFTAIRDGLLAPSDRRGGAFAWLSQP